MRATEERRMRVRGEDEEAEQEDSVRARRRDLSLAVGCATPNPAQPSPAQLLASLSPYLTAYRTVPQFVNKAGSYPCALLAQPSLSPDGEAPLFGLGVLVGFGGSNLALV